MDRNSKAILVTCPEQITHFVGCFAEGYLLLGDVSTLVTDPRYFYAVKNALAGKDVNVVLGGFDDIKGQLMAQRNVGLDFSSATVKLFKQVEEVANVFDATEDVQKLIASKSKSQLELIGKSCSVCEEAFRRTIPFIKEGVTELEVAGELEYNFKKLGAYSTSFDTIVAFGANSAVPHHQTSTDKLERNSAVLMDFGCKVGGYCSDMTRTMFFGTPDGEFLSAYLAVKNAHLKAKAEIRSGMNAADADAIARNVLKDRGLDKFFTHSLGHGVGTLIHEYPGVSPRSKAVLQDGNVFSIEPGVYFDGKFGIRIEDTVRLEDGKVKSFMTEDIELKILN